MESAWLGLSLDRAASTGRTFASIRPTTSTEQPHDRRRRVGSRLAAIRQGMAPNAPASRRGHGGDVPGRDPAGDRDADDDVAPSRTDALRRDVGTWRCW
jgi:hypothetical protein